MPYGPLRTFKTEEEDHEMKIAVITLPLHTNYGGLLQAYALKSVLDEMGHEAEVIDIRDKMQLPKGPGALFLYAKRGMMKLFKGSGAPEVFREIRYKRELPVLSANTSVFVNNYIKPRVVGSYSEIREGEYDAFVVGSDQVWRPRFFGKIEDAFLAFAEGWSVKRVAYAASFGTDQLEYEYMQLESCSRLLGLFDGVSVREDSAVGMCAEWFECDKAVHVLDPVMLLNAGIYRKLASSADVSEKTGGIMTYILDPSSEKSHVIDFMQKVSGMKVHDSSVYPYVNDRPVEERVVPSLEQWLASFINADFIITDSFHGCVLAIMLHKRFIATGNSRRGMARLNSLLSMFGLEMRLVHGIDPEDDGEFFLSDIDWEETDRILAERRTLSLDFLRVSLGLE